MHRECFPRHWLQRKPLVSDIGIHHGTCVTHVPWCMSRSLTAVAGKMFSTFPVHALPAILHIWQAVHIVWKKLRSLISYALHRCARCLGAENGTVSPRQGKSRNMIRSSFYSVDPVAEDSGIFACRAVAEDTTSTTVDHQESGTANITIIGTCSYDDEIFPYYCFFCAEKSLNSFASQKASTSIQFKLLNPLPPWGITHFKSVISPKTYYGLRSWARHVKLLSGECHITHNKSL